MNDGLGGCGSGGWTLVMKIDGNQVTAGNISDLCLNIESPTKQIYVYYYYYFFFISQPTFHYDSSLWVNNETFNAAGGETGFDMNETKLPTYWDTPFSKICLAMKIDQQINFIVIDKFANSLYSLIVEGNYRFTSLGRDKWKALIGSQGSLQAGCNKEGFNVVSGDTSHARVRIGITANDAHDCHQCDSRIGFGTGRKHDDSNTCGNEARFFPDNGDRHVKAMGYVLVKYVKKKLIN